MASAVTFAQMVEAARRAVAGISPQEVRRAGRENPRLIVIADRDAADLDATGVIPGTANISLGSLAHKAEKDVPADWRDSRIQDRARPIIVTCDAGIMSALGAKLLKDMGFQDVRYLEGGLDAWKRDGLPTEALTQRSLEV